MTSTRPSRGTSPPRPATPSRAAAAAFVFGRFRAGGRAWRDALGAEAWPPAARAGLLLALPRSRETWDLADRWAVADDYWRAVLGPGSWASDADAAYAVRRLLDVGRPSEAARTAALGDDELPADLLARVLGEIDPNDARGRSVDGWEVEKLLDRLAAAGRPDAEITRFEWKFFPLLDDRHGRELLLERRIVTDPAFFLELLVKTPVRHGGEPHAGEAGINELDEETRQAIGRRVRALLGTLPFGSDRRSPPCPGFADGSADAAGLRAWVAEARDLAARYGRAEMAEHAMGELLARSPDGADGAWPHEIVRDVLDDAPEPMRSGFLSGRRNGRGATVRGLRDGGEQERALQTRYLRDAEAIENGWSGTAALSEELADDSGRDAERHDERVTWER